ncbi:hypothetical protein E2P81_ATG11204 [Venturia nashicola]|nr:hypothetical protein E2P81_ATG11204 [Venturia nashicola]
MSNPAQNPQQRVQKRGRSRSLEPELDEDHVEQNGHDRRLKKAKTGGKGRPTPTASTEKSNPARPSSSPEEASPIQESKLTNDELLRKMMEDDDDDGIEAPRPDERALRKARHFIQEQIDTASKAKREMGKAIANFDNYFAQLERAHVYATTREALATRIECVPGATTRILNHTYRMKIELETLQRGIDDGGEMARLKDAILETDTTTEKINTHYFKMTKEMNTATNEKKPKGSKGFDDIKRLNSTMQELFKEFLKGWKTLLRFADLVGAKRDAEFERVEAEDEDEED